MTAGEFVYLIRADKSQLNSTLNSAEKDTKGWGNKLTAWTVAKGQMIANFATKAVTKITDIASSLVVGAVNAAAEYEQLVGGVETLFKEAAPKVQRYASQAYKNVGISANEYMANVTSFSASLLQSLGNDTDKAAEVADMAMIDMADNANKMGTAMGSIQNAYQGFAKQNYMMLDNLKLGYGGTKTEMERLLKDAGAIAKKTFDIKKLSDVYEAIHVIQQEMGIAGTTQKEAMETVQGSMNAAKAAWQDVLTAMGSGKDVKKSIKNFATTAKTALKNYAPVIRNAVEGMVEGAKELAPELGNIINEVGRGLFGKQWDITINWIQNAWNDVSNAFNTAVEWVGNAYNVTVEWIQNAWKTVSDAFTSVTTWVKDTYNATVEWVNNAFDTVSNAVTDAKKWVAEKYSAVVDWANKHWSNITHAFDDVKGWVVSSYKAVVKWANDAWNTISGAFTDVKNWVKDTYDATVNWIQNAWDDVKNAIAEVGKGIWNNTVNFILGLVDDVNNYIAKIREPINVAVNFVKGETSVGTSGGTSTSYGQDPTTKDVGSPSWIVSMPSFFAHAKGAWRIPYDNYPALLHRNEQVLTASQARQSESNDDYGYIAETIGMEIRGALNDLAFYLNGNKVGDAMTKKIDKNIRARTYSAQRAMGG